MKWNAVLAGASAALLVTLVTSMASAEVRIYGDPGGNVAAYVGKYLQIRDSGQRVVIDGPCLSACTLVTGIVPRDRICITNRAELGFHAASRYNDVTQSLVPTRAGSSQVMRLYPADIRNWIKRHGGLRPQMIKLRGLELAAHYQICE